MITTDVHIYTYSQESSPEHGVLMMTVEMTELVSELSPQWTGLAISTL